MTVKLLMPVCKLLQGSVGVLSFKIEKIQEQQQQQAGNEVRKKQSEDLQKERV